MAQPVQLVQLVPLALQAQPVHTVQLQGWLEHHILHPETLDGHYLLMGWIL